MTPEAAASPAVSVVVPSHGRRLRLRWLLNALEEQTLAPQRWEVVVVHDYDDRETHDTIECHPLFLAGRLRQIRIAAGTGGASYQRNLGWRNGRAPLIAFTDDDCRPDSDWLQRLVDAAERHPGAIVQGRTEADPLEIDVYASPHYRTVQELNPPGPFAQTCNILYPRAVLERVDGFDDRMRAPAGEDLDLNLRARAAGADYVGAPDARVYHCIEGYSLVGALRLARKWGAIAYLVKRHPQLRATFPLRVFWRETHLRLALAVAAVGLGRRTPLMYLLVAPYLRHLLGRRGPGRRAQLVCALEGPGQAVVDGFEVWVLIRASIRQRTLVL